MQDMHFEDIDWDRLWRLAWNKKSRKSKDAGDWDRKASSFAKRNADSVYNDKFIELLQPEPAWTILDVGSGPGTLAIPLAKLVKHVTAIDFSPGMLNILERRAAEKGIANITTCNLSLDDDWQKQGILQHDIVIASRSLSVPNLRQSLEQLNRFARKEVVISDKVGYGPFDPDAFQAVGRELVPGPDYIFTVNILYRMGFLATLDFIRLENGHRYSSYQEAVENYIWMFHDPTDEEQHKLAEYVRSIAVREKDTTISLHPRHVTTWAFMRWNPAQKRL